MMTSRDISGGTTKAVPLEELTLADGSISVFAAYFIESARSESADTSSCEFDLLGRQFASGPAEQDPVVVSHQLFSFFFFATFARLPCNSDLRTKCVLV
jgi:hypothetical protein